MKVSLISTYVQIKDEDEPRKTYKVSSMPLDSNRGLMYKLEGINRVFLESELIFIDSSNLITDKEDL
ncbi:hypothetical protein [Peptostreptococcus sp. MV1]|uniref:hypothetical protein n=1 Tax=Peptostreptococcus sp. MV1 TaxID=1219626 RepID=UPI0012EC8D16|nr:hypothetical protein [Peptostreptococcus sp. MV1]